ncbi:nuclear transport factor 2 family protein [Streptosporangium sandarakinum]|uniref:Ketosteroid isomerase-like protein n=1 Tax=Streptosporangium sandarakinum TaxID=1260955 RepID=A0A852UUY1_9ACTN|nr:nuclear transport factor 2 family protein [Streptosporangium sandarakinum]NYF40049.1 ketosteroid isomerase-like protein [Streptosporangium sandarakinum]
MNDVAKLVERYLATWNMTDAAERRAEIDTIWAEEARYVDPLADVTGRDAIDAVITAVQGQFPGMVFTLAGDVDAHHDVARFTWHLGPEGGEAIVIGFDVAVLTEDGRIREVHGFLDRVPAL